MTIEQAIIKEVSRLLEEKINDDLEKRDKLLLKHGELLAENAEGIQQMSREQKEEIEKLNKRITSLKNAIKQIDTGLTEEEVNTIVRKALPEPVTLPVQKDYKVEGEEGVKVETIEEDWGKTFKISLEDGKGGFTGLLAGTRSVLGATNRGVWARKVRVEDSAGNFTSKQLEEILAEIADSLVAQNEFIELTDTPTTYTGQRHKIPRVKASEDALEFTEPLLRPPVIDFYDPTGGLPVGPTVGDRYISDATAEGWTTDYVYEWDGDEWIESEPEEGWMVWMLLEFMFYFFFSGGWIEADSKVSVDASASPGYLGAASNDGVLRTGSPISYTDGGDYVTLDIVADGINDTHIDWGLGANQVSAVDLPIADTGGYYTGEEVESALQIIGKSRADSSHYTGFPNRTDTSLSWDDGTYTLTLTATADKIWIDGVEYEIDTLTEQLSVAQEAATSKYWFWITAPGGVPQLNCSDTFPGFEVSLTAEVYWNTTTSAGMLIDERHWFGRDRWNHEYLHETFGTRYAEGLAGTFDNTTLTIESGEFYDEDIEHVTVQETTAKVLYHNGDADWAWDVLSTPYKVVNPGVDDTLYYNNGNALTVVTNNRHTCSWVYISGDEDDSVHIYIDDAQYVTIASAREATPPARGVLTSPEDKLIYRIIYKNVGGTPTYIEADDRRASAESASGVTTDHGSLAGLSDDDHTQYALLAGRAGGQTVIGSTLTGEDLTLQDNAVDGNTVTVTQLITAYDHVSSDGSDHTFLDQSVVMASRPTFGGLTLTGNSLVASFGEDSSVINIGGAGTGEPNAFVGGYYAAAGDASTIYFSQNIYYNGSSWARQDSGGNTAIMLLQGGAYVFFTGTTNIGTQKFGIKNDGSVYMYGLNSYATRAAAGTDEIFVMTDHLTIPDGTLMLGT